MLLINFLDELLDSCILLIGVSIVIKIIGKVSCAGVPGIFSLLIIEFKLWLLVGVLHKMLEFS